VKLHRVQATSLNGPSHRLRTCLHEDAHKLA
jgi:hypothetical protein